MKILFTGASSFTGFWFIKELSKAGHEVTAIFRHPLNAYEGIRRERVEKLSSLCAPVVGCSFGDDKFISLLEGSNWDLLCHHAADVTNYKSPDFDFAAALANNTHRIGAIFSKLPKSTKVILTGSVFEQGEGAGSAPLRAFSPYGLSKGLTWEVFHYFAEQFDVALGKFVIPNPFGPYEDPRFTGYLIRQWMEGKIASVQTPAYVRDNIHVSLLAKAYVYFVENMSPAMKRFNPSQYAETQGAFSERFAGEMRPRLGCPCELHLGNQTSFPEPHTRINTRPLDAVAFSWDEAKAWDELAQYYKSSYAKSYAK